MAMMMMMMTTIRTSWIYTATKTKIRRHCPLSAANLTRSFAEKSKPSPESFKLRETSQQSSSSPMYYLPQIMNPWSFPVIPPLGMNAEPLNKNQASSQKTTTNKSSSKNKAAAKASTTTTTKPSSKVSDQKKHQQMVACRQSYLCRRFKKEKFLKSPIQRMNRRNIRGKVWTLEAYKSAVKRAIECVGAAFGDNPVPIRFVVVVGDDAKRFFGDMIREHCKYEHRNTTNSFQVNGKSWLDFLADRERGIWMTKSAAIFMLMASNEDHLLRKSETSNGLSEKKESKHNEGRQESRSSIDSLDVDRHSTQEEGGSTHRSSEETEEIYKEEDAEEMKGDNDAIQDSSPIVASDRQLSFCLDKFEMEDLVALEQDHMSLENGGDALKNFSFAMAGLQNLVLSLRAEHLATNISKGGPRWCFSRTFRKALQLQENESFLALVTVGQPAKINVQDRIFVAQNGVHKQLREDLIVDLY
jgi:hypothetical protein